MVASVACVLAFGITPKPATAKVLHVDIKNIAYGPLPATPHVGDVIEWSNHDFVAHTATARDGSFDVVLPPDKVGQTTLRHAGKTPFYCRYHPNMTGVLDVTP